MPQPIRNRILAAELLAQGHTAKFVAMALGVTKRTVQKWMLHDDYVRAHVQGKRQEYLEAIEGIAGIAMRELEAQLVDSSASLQDRSRAASIILMNRNRAIQAAASTITAEAIDRSCLHPDEYETRRKEILAELKAELEGDK